MILGLLLALASALATNVAFLFKYRGAVLVAPIRVRHPLRSAAEPIGSGPLAIGARFVAFCLVIAGAALMPSHHAEQPDTSTPPIKDTA